jgi:hypothetical protein
MQGTFSDKLWSFASQLQYERNLTRYGLTPLKDLAKLDANPPLWRKNNRPTTIP